jgi:hypothetical protein
MESWQNFRVLRAVAIRRERRTHPMVMGLTNWLREQTWVNWLTAKWQGV